MTTYARNLPEGSGTPAPPPPPPQAVSEHSALVLEMHAAARAAADAKEVFDAMDADLATYGPYLHAAWDRAHLAGQERYRTLTAYQNARKWQEVRVLIR